MSDFTARDLESMVDNEEVEYDYSGSTETMGGSEFWSEIQWGSDHFVFPGIGKATRVDSAGGMDEGSNIWTVFEVGGRLFRKSGYYASHYGTDWDGAFEEVFPEQKTITVYSAAR